MSPTPKPGEISWTDLTVEQAEQVRDFYEAVVGWTPEPLSMGTYSDFVMNANGTGTAGICHARGSNADLPPVWLIYITVDDLDHSLDECERLGGSLVSAPRSYGGGRYCVIKDPAGAICALYQPPDAA
ncbi:MAG TPA: VOC family protein [Vicinamibacterales bacterium]|jgi:predicted enzyme related to lactoylglutathione lyase|nr:VOC family protein [Vicinamibacterales bacterium]